MWNLIQYTTGNPLNIFLSTIGLASVLKTFPSYLDSVLDLKSNLDSSLKPNSNSNSCGLAITNSLNIFSISGYFGSYTL